MSRKGFVKIHKIGDNNKIYNFIEGLADKYDTCVGVNGSNLSGGQRQKIAMARAAAKGGRFFILDEATSNYDMESELQIIDFILNRLKDKTVIIITHKLQILKAVDKILLVENGNISDIGKHDELYFKNKVYKDLVDSYNESLSKNAV